MIGGIKIHMSAASKATSVETSQWYHASEISRNFGTKDDIRS